MAKSNKMSDKKYETSKEDKDIDKKLRKVGIKEDSKEDKRIDKMVKARLTKKKR